MARYWEYLQLSERNFTRGVVRNLTLAIAKLRQDFAAVLTDRG